MNLAISRSACSVKDRLANSTDQESVYAAKLGRPGLNAIDYFVRPRFGKCFSDVFKTNAICNNIVIKNLPRDNTTAQLRHTINIKSRNKLKFKCQFEHSCVRRKKRHHRKIGLGINHKYHTINLTKESSITKRFFGERSPQTNSYLRTYEPSLRINCDCVVFAHRKMQINFLFFRAQANGWRLFQQGIKMQDREKGGKPK